MVGDGAPDDFAADGDDASPVGGRVWRAVHAGWNLANRSGSNRVLGEGSSEPLTDIFVYGYYVTTYCPEEGIVGSDLPIIRETN